MVAVAPLGWIGRWYDPWRSVWAPPRQHLTCITPPTVMPVTVDEAVLHLRLAPDAAQGPEAPLIEGMIAAATQAVEDYASIAVMQQEWRMTLAHLPVYGDALAIPIPPLVEVLTFDIYGDAQDLNDYDTELDARFPSQFFPLARQWPVVVPRQRGAVVLTFRCGRDDPARVPATIKQAILLAIGTMYENRESLQQWTMHPMNELGWAPLLEPFRQSGFA